MDIYKFLLINLIYFAGISTAWSFGIGFYTIFRPVVAGMLTGVVLGDVALGMTAGAIVNIVYLDFVSFEDKLKGDPCLTAIIAVVAAIIFRINSIEAFAFAYLLGYLASFIWRFRLSINTFLFQKFNSKHITELVLPQLILLIMSIVLISVCFLIIFLLKDNFNRNYDFLSNLLFLSGIFILLNSFFSNIFSKNNYNLVFIYLLTFLLLFFVKSILIVLAIIVFLIYYLVETYKNLSKIKMISSTSTMSKSSILKVWLLWMNYSYFSLEIAEKKEISSFDIIKDNISIQVILSQIFALLCIYFALYENLTLLTSFSILFIVIIIYNSYSNFKVGFFNGKEALIQRIVEINKSKLKKYFNIFFSILFIIVIVNIKLKYSILIDNNVSNIITILIASLLFKVLSDGKIKEYYLMPIIYLLPLLISIAVPRL